MKSLQWCLAIGVAAAALLFSGCATITRGTSEQITIRSEPSGATVRLSNGFTGVTPAIFKVPRKGDIVVKATKEGFEDADITLKSHLSGKGTVGFLGNALIGGVIGGGVDVATGATLSHVPNPVLIKLAAHPVEVTKAPAPAPEPVAPTPVAAPATEKPAEPEKTVETAPPPVETAPPSPAVGEKNEVKAEATSTS